MKTKLLKKIRKRFVVKEIDFPDARAIRLFDLKNKESRLLFYNTDEIADILLSLVYNREKVEKRRKRINFNKELKNL